MRVKNVNNDFLCNFTALSKGTICESIGKMSKKFVHGLLKNKCIELTDYSDDSIGLLIGADIAGRLFTGRKCDFNNGLVAMETYLG